MHSLRFRDVTISWLNHTPHASAVYASCSASLPPHATLASQAARYGLTWAGLAPADRASFGWRLRISRPFLVAKADAAGPCCGPRGGSDWPGSPNVRLPYPIAAIMAAFPLIPGSARNGLVHRSKNRSLFDDR